MKDVTKIIIEIGVKLQTKETFSGKFFLQTLGEDLHEQRTSRDYISKTGNDLILKAPSSEKAEKLEADLKIVTKKWNSVSASMETRINELETACEQLKEYEVCHLHQEVII